MSDALPRGVRALARLLPAADRESIVGDLIEDAAARHIAGARLQLWLLAECGSIAAGLSVTQIRAWLVLPPVRELVAGLAVDQRGVLRGAHPSVSALLQAILFCASIATIALGVGVLVGSLLAASGFGG
jgi:hypothetical protein